MKSAVVGLCPILRLAWGNFLLHKQFETLRKSIVIFNPIVLFSRECFLLAEALENYL